MTDPNDSIIRFDPPAGQPSGDAGECSILFIGNATLLIRCAGFTILTDPTFVHKHEKVAIGYQMHSLRLTNPAVEIGDLPQFDFILLSHFHGDHFDQVAEMTFDKNTLFVTRPEAASELMQRGFRNPRSLETWETVEMEKGEARLRITSTPARHGPPLTEILRPDVMGSVLEFQTGPNKEIFRIYITGDTVIFDGIREIPIHFPEIDLALLHLGGEHELGVRATMDGEHGLEMLQIIRPERAIPIHFNDYDVFTSPLSDFTSEVEIAGLADKIQYLNHGDTYRFRVKSKLLMDA
jgi:L-ascorbate metabolism protein UlaG (beta-lactamase superfamily)